MGGFHVSGCLSMLDGDAVDLGACRAMGITMFAEDAEGRFDALLRDAAARRMAPVYNFVDDLPAIEGTPVPFLPKEYVTRTLGLSSSFDAGRRCPYQCSFCTIINVQGRKSRYRSADDVEVLVRANWANGISKFFITDDNFACNKGWEAIFDRLIELRKQAKIPLGLRSRSTPSAIVFPASSRKPSAPASRACSSGWRARGNRPCAIAKRVRQNPALVDRPVEQTSRRSRA